MCPSESTLHWQDLDRAGVPPDLYHVFGKLQVFLTPRVGASVAYEALKELANVIGLPTWVVTPEMLSHMWETEFRFENRRQKESESEYVSVVMSCFWVDIMYWSDRVAPERREEFERALRRFDTKIHTDGRSFFKRIKVRGRSW